MALTVAVVAPLLLWGLELLAGRAGDRPRRVFHLSLVGLLAAAILLQLLEPSNVFLAVLIALVAGGGAAWAYVRLRAARSLLSVLAPVPLVLLVLFLALSDVAPLVFGDTDVEAAEAASRAPVVLVVLDELPTSSLMDARARIDRRLYPNFARLADDATWYRNTTTVHADTPYAVPAILDGQLPRKEKLPIAADHPRSMFSLLGADYSLHVQEDATALCPRSVCREDSPQGFVRRMRSLWRGLGHAYLHHALPDDVEPAGPEARRIEREGRRRPETKAQRKRRLMGNLNRDKSARFEQFVRGIRGGGRPRLHLVHALLPHVPFRYLPSGRVYRKRPNEEIPGLNSSVGFHVQWLVEQGYQRHLLQLGETDRLLGVLLDRLRSLGLYDSALIAVVADHGAGFERGFDRRWVRPGNVEDIAPVPFFLKAPGQREGRISDKPLRTIDVVPTIADVLDVEIPWRVDGRSALRPTVPAQRRREVIGKRFGHVVPVDGPRFAAARRRTLRRKLALFRDGLFGIGPNRELVGQRVSMLTPQSSSGPHAEFVDVDRYSRVDPDSGFVPTHVVGSLRGGTHGGGKVVALAVNGRIEATGYTFSLAGRTQEDFSLIVRERVLRRGRNRVELLWIRGPGRVEELGRNF